MGWTRDEIRALVGGAAVFARDEEARLVDVPDWVAPRFDAPSFWDRQVAFIHVADRPAVVAAWWDAVAEPEQPVIVRFRSRQPAGIWHLVEARYLNLLGHPEVGSVLIIHDDLGETDPPPTPTEPDGGRASYEAPTWIIQHLDTVGGVLRTEGMVEQVFGCPDEDLVGRNVLEVLHPDDHDAAIAMWIEVVSTPGATRTIRQRVVQPDGTAVWLESTVMNQMETSGAIVAVSHDVSSRHHQEAALRASEREFRALADGVPTAVFRASAAAAITYANARCQEVLAPFGPLGSLLDIDPSGECLGPAWQDVVGGVSPSVETDVPCQDGRTLRLRCRAVASADEVVVIGTIDDVTEEVARTHELRSRVEIDALTGLVNRAGLDRRAVEVVERGADMAFVFVDLDGFKAVNDTWGHLAGDAVLVEVATRLRTVVRPDDVIARYGGDEFVLLCSGIDPDDDPNLVRRIGRAIGQPMVLGGQRWRPAASVGVVRPVPGETAAETLRRADQEMYRRKRRRT